MNVRHQTVAETTYSLSTGGRTGLYTAKINPEPLPV